MFVSKGTIGKVKECQRLKDEEKNGGILHSLQLALVQCNALHLLQGNVVQAAN